MTPSPTPLSPPHDRTPLTWTVALAGLWLVLALLPEATPWLRWEHTALVQGQPWRLLTGHLVHVDLRHAVGNAAALGVLWWLYGAHLERRQMAVGSLFIIVAVDIGLGLSREPQHWYVGGSGLLHGWMALGCFAGLRHKDPLAALGLAGLMGKLAWEGLDTPPPLAPGVAVAVVAHAWGTAGGLLGGIMAGRLARYTGAPDSQGRS